MFDAGGHCYSDSATSTNFREIIMIESIHIKNFRGIQDGKIDKFSKINLLVGPNNSGKSAVLEALYIANANSKLTTLERNGVHYDVLTAGRDLLGFDPLTRVCSRHLKQPVNGTTDGSLVKNWQATGFMLHIPYVAEEVKKCEVASYTVDENQPRDRSFPEFARAIQWLYTVTGFEQAFENDSITLFWESSLTYFQTKEAAWLIKGIIPSSGKTLFYDVSTSTSHLPFEYFRQMLGSIPGWTHKIAKRFERIFQIRKQFNVTFLQLQHDLSQTQGFIAPEEKVALTIDDYGDGARSAFKLLTPLIALAELATEKEPGVFIWEEPELFQNPLTLGRLLEEIADLIKGKPVQIFIATHSLDVIAQFTALAQNEKIAANDLMAFRLNLEEGQLTSSWFNYENLSAWLSDGLDPRVWGEFKSPLHFSFQEDGE